MTEVGDAVTRATDLADAAVAGDRRALARLLTAVENRSGVAEHAMRRLYPTAGRAHLVGTGLDVWELCLLLDDYGSPRPRSA